MSVVKHVSDRIAVMYLGRIVELSDKRELFANTLHPYTQALMNAIPIPDPTLGVKRLTITGEPPSPIDPPSGCTFHERCPIATELCRQVVPQLRDVGKGHLVACHHCCEKQVEVNL